MNNKTTSLVIIIYMFYHLMIEGLAMFFASISPLAEMFKSTEWIRYFAVIIAFVALLLDNYFYTFILKKFEINNLHKKIIFIIDVLILAVTILYFVTINVIYIFAESGSLAQVTHWIWFVSFVVLMFSFVYFSKSKYKKD